MSNSKLQSKTVSDARSDEQKAEVLDALIRELVLHKAEYGKLRGDLPGEVKPEWFTFTEQQHRRKAARAECERLLQFIDNYEVEGDE